MKKLLILLLALTLVSNSSTSVVKNEDTTPSTSNNTSADKNLKEDSEKALLDSAQVLKANLEGKCELSFSDIKLNKLYKIDVSVNELTVDLDTSKNYIVTEYNKNDRGISTKSYVKISNNIKGVENSKYNFGRPFILSSEPGFSDDEYYFMLTEMTKEDVDEFLKNSNTILVSSLSEEPFKTNSNSIYYSYIYNDTKETVTIEGHDEFFDDYYVANIPSGAIYVCDSTDIDTVCLFTKSDSNEVVDTRFRNAVLLDTAFGIDIKDLKVDVMYKLPGDEGYSIIFNDTCDYKITMYEDNKHGNIETKEDIIIGRDFTSKDNAQFYFKAVMGSSSSKQAKDTYFVLNRFTEDDKQSIINGGKCVKVSEIPTEGVDVNLDTCAYIYNDTDLTVKIGGYSKKHDYTFEEELPSDCLLDAEWISIKSAKILK